MSYRPFLIPLLPLLAFAFFGLSACAPEFQTDENTYKFFLDQKIRNITTGYYRRYYAVADTARWEALVSAADTVVTTGLPEDHLKFRTDGIWYEAMMTPNGLRAEQQYPGWESWRDSVHQDTNLLSYGRGQYMKVDIPAADIVLNGDSIRFGIIHATGPAYDWNFQDYEQQHDRLIMTTYGNDTMPITLGMDAVGDINRQTIFRIGRHSYVLRYFTPEYDAVIIDQLEDGRGLPYSAELDLNYKPIPVTNLDGTPTSIMRTPGKELLLYFWPGFDNEIEVQKIDSLYQSLLPSVREQLDIVLIARFNVAEDVQEWVTEHHIRFPVYRSTNKTCLRLNCPPYLPYFIRVDGRGRITNFYGRLGKLKQQLMGLAR